MLEYLLGYIREVWVNNMSKKIFIGLCFVLFVFSVIFTFQSYAYFSTTVTGQGRVTFASWDFEANDSPISFTTDLGDLYPGIDKSFQVKLGAIGSDVPVNYTVTFSYPNNIPSNLKFYRDAAKQNEINLNGGTVSGVLSAGTETVITIYYDWPYGSAAEEYVPGTAWFNMTISGRQTDPSGGA